MKQYDIIVVGTGGATIVADAALKKGLKVAIIEKGKFGGTCLTRGCIPTKVMVTAANAIQETKEFKKLALTLDLLLWTGILCPSVLGIKLTNLQASMIITMPMTT